MFFVSAQSNIGFVDNFSDGDFTNNPKWDASPDFLKDYIVNSKKELQLNATGDGKNFITTIFNEDSAMVWEFYLRMEFAPSKSNRLIIQLANYSTGGIMTPSLSYGILIGEDGADDRIRIGKVSANNFEGAFFSANSLIVRNNQVNARIRIKRSKTNFWTIETDYTGGFAFQKDGEFQEKAPFLAIANKNATFYLMPEFTSTRADKFFFDDFKVYKNEPDITAPKAILAKAIDKNKVEIQFDEVLDSLSAKQNLAYTLDNGAGIPKNITYYFDRVILEMNTPLQSGTTYNILINNVKDLAGNLITPQSLSFTTDATPVNTSKYDVIFNEIFADPSPQIALPKAEFIELYNRSKKTIDLAGWSVKDGGKTLYTLPKFTLLPQKYVIIYKRDANINFGKYGDTLALSSLFALDTEGDELSLFDEKKNLIDFFRYDLATYRDEKKQDGGYTLERTNPETPCLGTENWQASTSDDGGTPGKQNAVFSTVIDKNPIQLIYIFPRNATTIDLSFNRSLDLLSLNNLSFSGLKIKEINEGATPNSAVIVLENPMLSGKIYTVEIPSTVKDCVGNSALTSTAQIALPEVADAQDIVINEVLFNPKTGGYDFVELYNRSNKAINLANLVIDNRKSNNVQEEITSNYLLLPKSYVVISENTENVKLNYSVKNPNALLKNALPSFADDEGNVTLYRPDAPGKKIIDALDYNKSWHYPLLKNQSGVSLERINPDRPTQDSSNWHSAASIVDFATPTYQNSQFSLSQNTGNELFNVENPRVSPDNDGFEDFLSINYKLPNDIKATIRLFDFNGRLTKVILNNETLSTEGSIRWDGDTEEGSRATLGIYVLLIEYFKLDGTVGKEKKTVTVAYRL
jgi:hypothetical protein